MHLMKGLYIDGYGLGCMMCAAVRKKFWGMYRCFMRGLLIVLLVQNVSGAATTRPGKEYPDGHGSTVYLPLGDRSFADAALSYSPGKKAPEGVFAQGDQAVGTPDYRKPTAPGFISLGCNGTLVLQFIDNVLVDIEGVDLYVFEVGPAVEATELAISNDGVSWIEVGKIEGARADIDIAPFVKAKDLFYYVRLTNAGKSCGGRTPGADIDAVAAVGSAYRLTLSNAVLFDIGKADLKPQALAELEKIAVMIGDMGTIATLVIEGHTDNTGSAGINNPLSKARAQAVWQVLSDKVTVDEKKVTLQGYADQRPVASNTTEDGRALNRRVDIIVTPLLK